MRKYLFSLRSLTLGALIAAFAATPAQAATMSTVTCPNVTFSQPFLSLGDSNWYTLVPGQNVGWFTGAGWTFTGGAKALTTTLANGSTGSALDMPAGSRAVSPPMCVATGYPIARMMSRTLASAPGSVTFYVSPAGSGMLGSAMPVLGTPTWALSPPVNVAPGNVSGTILVQFTFIAPARGSDFQIYNFYVDPRMCR
jgi:hypothetical protein